MPRQNLLNIESAVQLSDFRDQIQQQIYAGLEYLKQQREVEKV